MNKILFTNIKTQKSRSLYPREDSEGNLWVYSNELIGVWNGNLSEITTDANEQIAIIAPKYDGEYLIGLV